MGNEKIEPENERKVLKEIRWERKKKKLDKRQKKKIQEQDLIFHYSFVGPHLFKNMISFGWMKLIRVLCYRRKGKVVSQRGGDWVRFQERLNQTLEEMVVIFHFSSSWKDPHSHLHFGFWKDLARGSSCLFRLFHGFLCPVSISCRSSGYILAGAGRKEIEEDFGERDPASARIRELTHTLSISPHPACCAWVLHFPVESFLFFPLNQSVLGNINPGIMANLSMWERRDAAAVLVVHLGSSYSRERARGLL